MLLTRVASEVTMNIAYHSFVQASPGLHQKSKILLFYRYRIMHLGYCEIKMMHVL